MEASNQNVSILQEEWVPGPASIVGMRQIKCGQDVVALAGSATLPAEINIAIGNVVSAAPDLRSACQRALDWHQLSNQEYWLKYGQPDPGSENTLAHVLMAALAKADGRTEIGEVPPSDDTQGKLFS